MTTDQNVWRWTHTAREVIYGAYIWGCFGAFVGFVGQALDHVYVAQWRAALWFGMQGAWFYGLVGAGAGILMGLEAFSRVGDGLRAWRYPFRRVIWNRERTRCVICHDNGQTRREEHFRDGRREGFIRYYWPDGTLQSSFPFVNGVPDGVMAFFHPHGEKSTELLYQGGSRQPDEGHWNEKGDPILSQNTSRELKDQWELVVIGDIHDRWDEDDDIFYRMLDADLLLFTGDLSDRLSHGPRLAQRLASLPRAYGILGNHDGAHVFHVIQEARGNFLARRWLQPFHAARVRQLRQVLGTSDLAFAHREIPTLGLTLMGTRPHSTGGKRPTFASTLRQVYGINDSTFTLRAQIDACPTVDLIFLGHNGPQGLGTEPYAPFGRDWREQGGDHGDADYAEAMTYAQARGKKVLLAIAGHMHNQLHPRQRPREQRVPFGFFQGVPVLNACIVPRIRAEKGEFLHYHFRCTIHRHHGLQRVARVCWQPGQWQMNEEVIYPCT